MSEQVTEAQVKEIEAAVQAHVNNWSSRGFSTPLATSCAALCASWRARGEEIADLRAALAAAERDTAAERALRVSLCRMLSLRIDTYGMIEDARDLIDRLSVAERERDGCAANLATTERLLTDTRRERDEARAECSLANRCADSHLRSVHKLRQVLVDSVWDCPTCKLSTKDKDRCPNCKRAIAAVEAADAALRAEISGATDGDQQLPIAAGSYQCDGQGEEGRP
ncbi:MAG TPA: hypothetical protein VFH17_07145 [Coriobacteriia bacterium]|nr:hypothetical protein [Coriobacteriia bacterium]